MSWFNTRVFMQQKDDRNTDFNEVIAYIFEGIRADLKRQEAMFRILRCLPLTAKRNLPTFSRPA